MIKHHPTNNELSTSSIHSLLCEQIIQKVSERQNSNQISSQKSSNLDKEKMIKRELKKAVHRILKASNKRS